MLPKPDKLISCRHGYTLALPDSLRSNRRFRNPPVSGGIAGFRGVPAKALRHAAFRGIRLLMSPETLVAGCCRDNNAPSLKSKKAEAARRRAPTSSAPASLSCERRRFRDKGRSGQSPPKAAISGSSEPLFDECRSSGRPAATRGHRGQPYRQKVFSA